MIVRVIVVLPTPPLSAPTRRTAGFMALAPVCALTGFLAMLTGWSSSESDVRVVNGCEEFVHGASGGRLEWSTFFLHREAACPCPAACFLHHIPGKKMTKVATFRPVSAPPSRAGAAFGRPTRGGTPDLT